MGMKPASKKQPLPRCSPSGSWESSPANKPSSPSLRLPTLPPSAQHVLQLLHARCRSLPPLRIPPTCPSATSSPAPRRSARLGAWHLLLGLPTPTRCRPGKMAPTTVASTPAPPHPYRFIWADALLPQEGVRRTPPPALPRVRSARRYYIPCALGSYGQKMIGRRLCWNN